MVESWTTIKNLGIEAKEKQIRVKPCMRGGLRV